MPTIDAPALDKSLAPWEGIPGPLLGWTALLSVMKWQRFQLIELRSFLLPAGIGFRAHLSCFGVRKEKKSSN